uniref:Ig-like domain-containing protein n=1 Tax=Naja naja TaxID=35670 RepID=A0A8C6X5C8_NAJNA
QITLTQSSLIIKKQGESSIRLTCTVSGFSVAESYIDWIRQCPGERLEWIGRVAKSGSVYYNSILQNRLTFTTDTSKNQGFIQVNGLKSEDTALYYCVNNTQ